MSLKSKISELTKPYADWALNAYDSAQRLAFRLPGIKVDRNDFLCKILPGTVGQERTLAAVAGRTTDVMSADEISSVAKKTIVWGGLYTALATAVLTLPNNTFVALFCMGLDLVQSQLAVFVVAQKLLYIHGFDQNQLEDKQTQDQISRILWIVSVVMVGRGGIRKLAKSAGSKVTRMLIRQFSIRISVRMVLVNMIKQIAKWCGVVATQQIINDAVDVAVAVACALVAGAFSFWIFLPLARNLNRKLSEVGVDHITDDFDLNSTD